MYPSSVLDLLDTLESGRREMKTEEETSRRTEAAVFLNNQLSELRCGFPNAIDTSSRLKLAYNV
jgi:hypothetical protein